jgi:hypothetical protein
LGGSDVWPPFRRAAVRANRLIRLRNDGGRRMIVTPTNKSVTELEDLHLFHADISNCSMRVRMVLAEKELPWTSHHLDLRKKRR